VTDIFSKEKRSEIMSKIRSKGTKIEIVFESKLKENHIRYVSHPKMEGNPDFVVKGAKVAVFVDGEFWHGRQWLKNGQVPPKGYWQQKILANVKRDRRTNRKLRKNGWSVVRFWERDVLKSMDSCISRLEKKIKKRKLTASSL